MLPKLELTKMAQAMAAHAGARMEVIARNVANADTPGFKAQDLAGFAKTYAEGGDNLRATRAGHLQGAGSGQAAWAAAGLERIALPSAPNGNSVSIEAEMMRAAETRQQHDMALSIYTKTSDILKTALGRGR
jgi:flagellar basal-body rod protein FlgB